MIVLALSVAWEKALKPEFIAARKSDNGKVLLTIFYLFPIFAHGTQIFIFSKLSTTIYVAQSKIGNWGHDGFISLPHTVHTYNATTKSHN